MEDVIQDLSKKLWTSAFAVKWAFNYLTNSSMKSVATDDNPDGKLALAITKKLAGSLTRNPVRCLEWFKSSKAAVEGLNSACTLIYKALSFLPTGSAATKKMKRTYEYFISIHRVLNTSLESGVEMIYFDGSKKMCQKS